MLSLRPVLPAAVQTAAAVRSNRGMRQTAHWVRVRVFETVLRRLSFALLPRYVYDDETRVTSVRIQKENL